MAKEVKVLKVKDVEVIIEDDKLVFEKDGIQVELPRLLGKSDYRTVYEFLKKKTNTVKGSNQYSVGNFSYSILDYQAGNSIEKQVVVVDSLDNEVGSFVLEQDLETVKYPHQFVRNLVINFILTTLGK